MNVYFPGDLEQTYRDKLRNSVKEQINLYFDEDEPEGIDVLIDGRPEEQILGDHAEIKRLIIPYAGLSEATRETMLSYPEIHVHNLHHNAVSVAEYTLALLLTAVKNLVPMHNALAKNDWTLRYQSSETGMLQNGTALILGFGAIGRAIAERLKPFQMNIHAIRNNGIEAVNGYEYVELHQLKDLHTLLPSIDFLIITLPLTPQTHDLISTKEIALLSSRAFIINVGRGEVLNQRALYAALRSKKIAGAALDVWYNYPKDTASRNQTPPAEMTFHDLNNIVMSPHKAGGLSLKPVEEKRMQSLADLLNSLERDPHQPGNVDINAGY